MIRLAALRPAALASADWIAMVRAPDTELLRWAQGGRSGIRAQQRHAEPERSGRGTDAHSGTERSTHGLVVDPSTAAAKAGIMSMSSRATRFSMARIVATSLRSHAAIDAGADIVIGQGPHVPCAVQLYRGHLIAYSLGNFWTYTGVMNYAVSGLGPVLEAWLAPDGTIAGFTIHSTRQAGLGGPAAPRSGRRSGAIRLLSHQDGFSADWRADRRGARDGETCSRRVLNRDRR